MSKEYQNLTKGTIVCLFLGILAVSSSVLAQQSRRDDTGREPRTSEKDLRKKEMREEASKSFPELSDALGAILEKVGKNQRSTKEQIEQARQLLEANKRNGQVYDKVQRSQYMLLRAWTDFYQGNLPDAMKWSMRACRTDDANQDAWISQTLFCILSDERPLEKRRPKEKSKPEREDSSERRSRRKRNGNERMGLGMGATPTLTRRPKTVLEFDLSALRKELFTERFARLEYRSDTGAKVEYVPGQEMLCALFWQSERTVADANNVPGGDAPPKKEPDKTEMMDPMMMGMPMPTMGPGMVSHDRQESSLEKQQLFFSNLSKACKDNETIKFVQFNTTKPKESETYLDKLPPSEITDYPTVVTANPESGAEKFLGVDAETPFMLIADKEGKVKYAGPVTDFMSAFILTELTGIELELEKMKQAPKPPQPEIQPHTQRPSRAKKRTRKQKQPPMPMMMDPMMMGMPMPMPPEAAPPKPVAEPNKPSADPNTPAEAERPVLPPVPKQSSDFPTQSLEDQLRADNLLRAAQMHIEESRKLHMKNPKQGIEAARQVLKEFPNTESAQQARELLRRVPDRWKKRHSITDEELGY